MCSAHYGCFIIIIIIIIIIVAASSSSSSFVVVNVPLLKLFKLKKNNGRGRFIYNSVINLRSPECV
jgi:hypothetical protein